jgi:hypothetical protein
MDRNRLLIIAAAVVIALLVVWSLPATPPSEITATPPTVTVPEHTPPATPPEQTPPVTLPAAEGKELTAQMMGADGGLHAH